MAHELEYVVKDALMLCDKGAAPGFFNPTQNMHIKINGCLVTNKMDVLPIVNIPTFGICSLTQCACVPAPIMWKNTYDVKVKGNETLLYSSCLQCGLGGKIEFATSGQIPLPPDALEDIQAMQEEGQVEDEGWTWLDTVELIPVVGSIVGAVREGIKGNWGMVAMNVGFLALDVAGLVSFGATTAASTAGKAAVKAGIKVAAKTVAKNAAKTALKTGAKLCTKGAAKAFKSSISTITLLASKGKKCVYACFTAGTPIHTEHGIKNIESIEVGDNVWSFNEKTGEVALKKVLSTIDRTVDATIHIKTDKEVIETTAEHPFYVNEEWIKATNLKQGNEINTINGEKYSILEAIFEYNLKKVYNFEVEDWNNYFVGFFGFLTHNARPCFATMLGDRTPNWLKTVLKGNYFNFIRESYYKRMGGFNEVVLKNGKRLDSYIPGKEIISRKFTQLGDNFKKGKNYIDEMAKKYKKGSPIKETPRNAEPIEKGGKTLSGETILEIPPQKQPINKETLDYAKQKGVKIRDTNGKVY